MNTYRIKITCGENHEVNFRFNTELTEEVVNEVLSSVVKKNYTLTVIPKENSSKVTRDLEWAINRVKSTRFYKTEYVDIVKEFPEETVVACGSTFKLPKDFEIKQNQTEKTFFFSINTMGCPLKLDYTSLAGTTRTDILPTIIPGRYYIVGKYKFDTLHIVGEDYNRCQLYKYVWTTNKVIIKDKKFIEL